MCSHRNIFVATKCQEHTEDKMLSVYLTLKNFFKNYITEHLQQG